MGTNSNRSRTRCVHEACKELTRSNSGLCRLHILTPAEAVIVRRERPLADDFNRWPLVWQGGIVQRDRLRQTSTMPVEASQSPQTVSDATTSVSVAPTGNACDLCGLSQCDRHADGSEVTHRGYTLEEMVIFTVGVCGLAAVAAWTLHNHGLI